MSWLTELDSWILESGYLILNQKAEDVLDQFKASSPFCCFIDPPDNLGLDYDGYVDKVLGYHAWLEKIVEKAYHKFHVVWLSYYYKHDFRIKEIVNRIKPSYYRQIIWNYGFGQYQRTDFTNCYRPILVLAHSPIDISRVVVPSVRNKLGDNRATGGRFLDDVWQIPRVQGNNKERRAWHPTQHPELVMERIVKLSGLPLVDLFSGTGTGLRVCRRLGVGCLSVDQSYNYCVKQAQEAGFRKQEGCWK